MTLHHRNPSAYPSGRIAGRVARRSTAPLGRAFWRRPATPTGAPQRPDVPSVEQAAPLQQIPGLDAARTRLRYAMQQYGRLLRDRIARQADVTDTALIVRDFLSYGLGFRADEITKVQHFDGDTPVMTPVYQLSVDGDAAVMVEILRCCGRPGERHVRNLRPVASAHGVEWAVVTNGSLWQLHHVGGHDGVLAFETDVVGACPDGTTDTTPIDTTAASLALVSREACAQQALQRHSSRLFA